jgi:hypothetical protein
MIKTEIKQKIVFPKEFLTQDDLLQIGKTIFVPLLGAGIDAGIGVDGRKLPEPEKSTIKSTMGKMKRQIFTKKGNIRASAISKIGSSGLRGFTKRVLVETGKLRRSFFAKKSGKYGVTVSILGDRKEIGGYLQFDGIKTKHGRKFYNFFGITDGMEKDAMDYAKTKISEACEKFNGKK